LNKKNLNTGYCGLALGLTGTFNTLKYLGWGGLILEGIFLGTALLLLIYFAREICKSKINILGADEKSLSLLPTIFMTLGNISGHMELKKVWLIFVGLHLIYGLLFYRRVVFRGAPLVSYYIPLVGIAVNIPYAHLFQMDTLGSFLLVYGGAGYLIVSCRMLFYWRRFRKLNPLPLMGILCAPLALWAQGGFIYLEMPVVIKGAVFLSLLTTLAVYLIVPVVLARGFSTAWASLTFPTAAASLSHIKGGVLLESSELVALGYCEVVASLGILFIVTFGTLGEILRGGRGE